MVHALTEAHRVLKPNGILLDLRPGHQHRRAGLGEGATWEHVGSMREPFDDDYAADHSVKEVIGNGLFRQESLSEFSLDRVMDTLEDFRVWLEDFPADKVPSHDWLYKKVERALTQKPAGTKIAIRGPLRLGVLRKIENDIP
jgi:SAM-dependent methyltransferase